MFDYAASGADARVEEALQVALTDLGKAGSYVIQLAGAHPAFEGVDQVEDVVEGIGDEEQGLVVVDLRDLVDGPLELGGEALHLGGFDGVLEWAINQVAE